jgi:outer membrane protein OmpA-like peptidoglycan-associated protein
MPKTSYAAGTRRFLALSALSALPSFAGFAGFAGFTSSFFVSGTAAAQGTPAPGGAPAGRAGAPPAAASSPAPTSAAATLPPRDANAPMVDPQTGIADPLGPAPKVGERPAAAAPGAPADASGSGAGGAGGAGAATSANELPPAGDATEAPEGDQTWAERDRQVNESSTLSGGVGLLHLQHAQGLAPGQFNLAFVAEYFAAGFLCTSNFPCTNQSGGPLITSDQMNHIGGNIALTMGLTKWLEGYLGTSAYANSDTANQPSLLQVLGDTNLGLKAYGHIGKVLNVGGGAELWLINGTGAVGVAGGGTSAKFRGLATADLRNTEKHTPLRLSLNLTYSLDNTADVVSDYEAQKGAPITRIERYGLGINRVDHFDIGLGVEGFFVGERVRPFIEYNLMVPINRQNYACPTTNASFDNCLATDQLAPSKLTIGGRFLPWKHGFSVTAALDIGVTGQNDFIEEMAPIPPWTLYLGAGWTVDTWDRPPVVETKIVERGTAAPPPLGHIKGYVDEVGKPEVGVPNAIVSFANHPDITALATGPDGRFATLGLPPGKYDLAVKADGYKDGTCSVTLAEPPPATDTASAPPLPAEGDKSAPAPASGPPVNLDSKVTCSLESLPKVGKVSGHVRDAETRSGVGGAALKLTDSGGHEFTQTADANGNFHFEGLAPAGYQLAASADQYMNDVESVDVKPRQDAEVNVILMKRPKVALVAVTQKEITIRQQVQFATDSATILPASTGLLTEIADVLERNPRIHKVEIQGHTDSNGDDAHNQTLSDDRANSVRAWLVSHGVGSDRLIAKGYGETKPLVPNVTDSNRQRNRRVQFIILDQDKAPPMPGGAF